MGGSDRGSDNYKGVFALCRRWSGKMERIGSTAARVDFMAGVLPELLLDTAKVSAVLERIASGDPSLKPARGGLFDNEVLIYLDPRRLFSIRVYFHEAGRYTPIHDHSSWGILGTPFGSLGIVRYRRTDDGADPDLADLERTRSFSLSPGKIDTVFPLEEGIHQTGSPGGGMNVMISAYGSPLRRLYIRTFDPVTGRVTRHFPPKIRNRQLAKEAVELLRPAKR